MGKKTYDEILDEELNMLAAGATIEQCVARYPEHGGRLREELAVAQDLISARSNAAPDGAAQARGRARLLAAAGEQRRLPAAARPAPAGPLFGDRSLITMLPKALPAVVAMLVLGGAAWGVSAAATGDGPQGWFESDTSQGERVELRGRITAIDANSITIATGSGKVALGVVLETEFEDENETPLTAADFAVGDPVKISAIRDANGNLLAREIKQADEGDTPSGNDADQNEDSGPGPNRGPGNAEEDPDEADREADDEDEDQGADENSGPGHAEDDEGMDEVDDGEDNDDKDEEEGDHSGPGGGGDEESEGSEDD